MIWIEQCISIIEKRANGQDEFDALRRHYSGDDNVSRRVAMADHLREMLHYKRNFTMLFNMFLYRMHNMFNIFRNKGYICPTARKCASYSGGFSTHNYKIRSRLLNLDHTLMASNIQRPLTTSQTLF